MSSQWAAKRKLTYLIFIAAAIVVVLGVPLFFILNKTATCSDGVKNQNEKGIDCGGVCTRLCQSDVVAPIVLWQRAFIVAPGVYNVVAYIQNPNVLMRTDNTAYMFRLYDDNNVIIGERKGKTFIPANQNFTIFEAGVRTSNRVPARTSFSFTDTPMWIQNASNYKAPDLVVNNIVLTNESSTPRIDASINNKSLQKIGTLEAVVVVYDSNDNAVDASRTIVENLAAHDISNVTFTWPNPFASSAVRKEILLRAYPTTVVF